MTEKFRLARCSNSNEEKNEIGSVLSLWVNKFRYRSCSYCHPLLGSSGLGSSIGGSSGSFFRA